MTDDRPAGEASGWMVQPPVNGLRISLDFSEDAPMTPDLRSALERLVRVIEDETAEVAETEGFQVFRPRPKCPAKCPSNMTCSPEERRPCADKYIVDCTIINQPCQPALM